MNERYLFKGKRVDNGEWVEGLLTQIWGQLHIINPDDENTAYPIIPETIGQCTGLRDKNGKLIFKDDVLKGFIYPFLSDEEHNYYAIVVWFEDSAAFGIYTIKKPESKVRGISSGNTEYMSEWDSNNWEIIGNIHDNPELLEVQPND